MAPSTPVPAGPKMKRRQMTSRKVVVVKKSDLKKRQKAEQAALSAVREDRDALACAEVHATLLQHPALRECIRWFTQPTKEYLRSVHPITGARYCDEIKHPMDLTRAAKELKAAMKLAPERAAAQYVRSLLRVPRNALRFCASDAVVSAARAFSRVSEDLMYGFGLGHLILAAEAHLLAEERPDSAPAVQPRVGGPMPSWQERPWITGNESVEISAAIARLPQHKRSRARSVLRVAYKNDWCPGAFRPHPKTPGITQIDFPSLDQETLWLLKILTTQP